MTNSCSQLNPIKEETYAFIGCLRLLEKKYKLSLGFHADFIKAQFFTYIYNKLVRWDGDIREAVKLWCSDPAAAEEKYGHISKWDVSRVTDMNKLFENFPKFNEDISRWDVSNVKDMSSMFSGARAFNQPLSAWNVSNVTSIARMFYNAKHFKKHLFWNVSNVINMEWMFAGAIRFNGSISEWDVSNVTTMEGMFSGAIKFN